MYRYIKSGKRIDKLEQDGWQFETCEYDGDIQREERKYKQQGYQTKVVKVRTDTPGLKMYYLYIKED